jgi:hypothetical protein
MKDTITAKAAFDTAYADVKNAFLYFLNNENKGRPLIIAAHSQGTIHAGRLIKELVERSPLKERLIAAYLIGIGVPDQFFDVLPVCNDEKATGCFLSWRSFRYGYTPRFIQEEAFKAAVVNPLTWTTDPAIASKEKHRGAILYKFNSVFPHTNDAQIAGNMLWLHKPKFPGSFLYRIRNYHIGDINLFYLNIRQNVETRINTYLEEKSK